MNLTLREKSPYFPAFGLNTDGVSLRIQSECGKIQTLDSV